MLLRLQICTSVLSTGGNFQGFGNRTGVYAPEKWRDENSQSFGSLSGTIAPTRLPLRPQVIKIFHFCFSIAQRR